MGRPVSAALMIESYIHCGRCIDEFNDPANAATRGHSPATWAKLGVGFTRQGLQVWCQRHQINVVHIDFEGQRHPANMEAA